MRIFTFTFSPTGSSAKIVRGISEGIAEVCDSVVIGDDLTRHCAKEMELNGNDVVIASAPVYGGKISPLIKQRLKDLNGHGAKCIVVAVYGNRAFEKAVVDFASFMSERGFVVCGAGAFVGEHSYSTAETPIALGRPDSMDMADAKTLGMEIGRKIRSEELSEVDPESLVDEESPEESMINFRNFVVGYQRQQAENPVRYVPVVDESVCDDCGSCYAVCPTEAITAESHEADETRCIKCCACVKMCPQGARELHSPFARPLSENFKLRKSPRWIL